MWIKSSVMALFIIIIILFCNIDTDLNITVFSGKSVKNLWVLHLINLTNQGTTNHIKILYFHKTVLLVDFQHCPQWPNINSRVSPVEMLGQNLWLYIFISPIPIKQYVNMTFSLSGYHKKHSSTLHCPPSSTPGTKAALCVDNRTWNMQQNT